MKYNIITASLWIMLLALVQCTSDIESREAKIPEKAIGISLQISDMKVVDITAGTRSAETPTRSTEQGVGNENTIGNVYIYLFAADGNSVLSGSPFKFYAADNTDPTQWADANTVIIRKTPQEAASRLVYVVANVDESNTAFAAALNGATTVTQLKNVVKTAPVSVPAPFLMEGHTAAAHNFAANRRADVTLYRAIAKLEFTLDISRLPQLDATHANAYKLMQFGNRTWVIELPRVQDLAHTTGSPDWIPLNGTLTFSAYVNEYAHTLSDGNKTPYVLVNLPYKLIVQQGTQTGQNPGLPPPEADPDNPVSSQNIVLLPPPEFEPDAARQHNYYRVYMPVELKRNHLYRYKMTVTQQGSHTVDGGGSS